MKYYTLHEIEMTEILGITALNLKIRELTKDD